ncbi:MAG: tRNA pseudouridine(55) synthase TruB [Eubacteriales bacterium]|jgi:tRNA pseudouridine55 synthase
MINGVINVYKEAGYTSHDVVAKLRGIVHQKRIGHTGTLDPGAVGVLPVCLGKATRVTDILTDETKTYEAVMLLGVDTDTQDASGKVLSTSKVTCTEDEIRAVLKSFEGDQMQIPPMYSALKVNGKKLYELAREGKTVERKARPVHFYEIRALSFDLPRVTMRVSCSRGTYIRTLCHDIGEKLGCGACMERLTRTRVGIFKEADAFTLGRIEEIAKEGRLKDILIPTDQVFRDVPSVSTRDKGDILAHNGNKIPAEMISEFVTNIPFTGEMRVYDSVGIFSGLYRVDEEQKILVPLKIFYDSEESIPEVAPYAEFCGASEGEGLDMIKPESDS